MESQSPLRLVIIGGVAGGMSAATRARRVNENASITVLEKGGYISFANCGLPYYLDGRIAPAQKLLLTTPQAVKARYNIDALVHHEAVEIDRAAKVVHAVDLPSGRKLQFHYDKLLVATGALPIAPPLEHCRAGNVFFMRSMEDALSLHEFLEKKEPKRAVVVGAGFIGLEVAEALTKRGLEVTVLEKAPNPLPQMDGDMAQWITRELANHQVRVICGDGIAALHGSDEAVTAVKTECGKLLETDLVLLSIGVRPNSALAAKAGLTLAPDGAICVDEYQRTNDPDIYAVGDVAQAMHGVLNRPMRVPLAGPANRQGRLAGEHAVSGDSAPAGKVLGSAIVQVFDLAIGMTGLSMRAAEAAGLDVDTAIVLPNDHAGYYPGAQQMRVKLAYEKTSGRILGAQICGPAGVDKRLDVIATAIHFGGTVHDLARLDLVYAPQFSGAKDPVHYAAFVAENQMSGLTQSEYPPPEKCAQLLDVRSAAECERGIFAGAINIPVDELRSRMDELDRQRPVTVYCQVGLRGYLAQRILAQNGFEARNIKGGYAMNSPARGK